MADNTENLTAARQYINNMKGHDPIIEQMNSTQLSQFLNIVCQGHPMFWNRFNCPWCGESNVDAKHVLEECTTDNCAWALRVALNQSHDMETRMLGVRIIREYTYEIENYLRSQSIPASGFNVINITQSDIGGQSDSPQPTSPHPLPFSPGRLCQPMPRKR